MQAAPATQALASRDTNKQTAAATAPAKKPLRPVAAVHSQNAKAIADDDDAALQVRAESLLYIGLLVIHLHEEMSASGHFGIVQTRSAKAMMVTMMQHFK